MDLKKLGAKLSRKDVLTFLFESSRYGNLGLFVGAGFSKAVFSEYEENPALSWGDLLKEVGKRLGVSVDDCKRDGMSYAELASALCAAHAEREKCAFSESLSLLKVYTCEATALFPAEPERGTYSSYLRAFAPAWIITTNYDQVLECLLPGRSVSLDPSQTFSARRGRIPIYHLHGVRTRADQLVIAQEDYVSLFRPNEYRQIRLALTLKESTTCLLGYGLGDVNVLTALDWSTRVYEEGRGDYPHEVIQVLRKKEPLADPYRLNNGTIVVETSEISEFCGEYRKAARDLKRSRKRREDTLKVIKVVLEKSDDADVKRFIDNEKFRHGLLKVLSKFSLDVVAEFEEFLEKALGEIVSRSGQAGAFNEYTKNLNLILDLLTAFDSEDFPPALLPVAARNFNRLATYIGEGLGSSWSAQRTWDSRKSELTADTVKELRAISRQYKYTNLARLLKAL